MTIEQIIEYLPAPICGSTVIDSEKQKEYEAHDSAVIILRKYEKIQEIIDNWQHDPIMKWNDIGSFNKMVQISEVLNGDD